MTMWPLGVTLRTSRFAGGASDAGIIPTQGEGGHLTPGMGVLFLDTPGGWDIRPCGKGQTNRRCSAMRHEGQGWLDYDHLFWQQAALNHSLP